MSIGETMGGYWSDSVLPRIQPLPQDYLQLRAVVLLGGSVGTSSVHAQVGRSVLELPLTAQRTLMDVWREKAKELAQATYGRLPLRVVVDRGSELSEPLMSDRLAVSFERDPLELRGTGGILRDLAAGYGEDDWILVCNAGQLLRDSLLNVVERLSAVGADTVVVTNGNGTPSSALLVRCACLRLIPAIGFIDMKEQALPLITRQFKVAVCRYRHALGLPIRTLGDYISALRWHQQSQAGRERFGGAFDEEWDPCVSVVEPGAAVDSSARIHDSVVLSGATVRRGATVVRSVIGPGAVVAAHETIVDQVRSARRRS